MRTALVGALLFKGLGGSFRGLAPSDVCRPGAFFRRRVRMCTQVVACDRCCGFGRVGEIDLVDAHTDGGDGLVWETIKRRGGNMDLLCSNLNSTLVA